MYSVTGRQKSGPETRSKVTHTITLVCTDKTVQTEPQNWCLQAPSHLSWWIWIWALLREPAWTKKIKFQPHDSKVEILAENPS